MATQTITFKASPEMAARLAEVAEERQVPKGLAIKQLLMEAGPAPARDGSVADEAELLELLTEAARSGNVSAMKELRVYHRERSRNDEQEESDPFAAADELAVRRAAA